MPSTLHPLVDRHDLVDYQNQSMDASVVTMTRHGLIPTGCPLLCPVVPMLFNMPPLVWAWTTMRSNNNEMIMYVGEDNIKYFLYHIIIISLCVVVLPSCCSRCRTSKMTYLDANPRRSRDLSLCVLRYEQSHLTNTNKLNQKRNLIKS